MGSKANSQQAPVHWTREITKAKLSQAKFFFIHIFLLKNGKRGEKRAVWAILGNFGQVLASWDKFAQVNKLNWASLGKFKQVWASLGEFWQVWASLDKFGQFWVSLGKFGQVWASLGKLS